MGEGPKRHLIIPDTQTRPGVPLDHLAWVAQAIVDYKPDTVIHLGDHWDFPSLNGHEKPGSAPMEGKRFADDVFVGNEAFKTLCKPVEEDTERLIRNKKGQYASRRIFLTGNHEARADRVASNDPKLLGTVGSDQCDVRGWERHGFLERVWADGICYSHYFQNQHSSMPIGGSIDNRLNKIGCSFVQGHEQGRREGNRITSSGRTWYGLVAGSCYLHVEDYRGAQGQRHWRGIVVLNEVEDGEYDIMPLSLRYLCKKYEGVDLVQFCKLRYPNGDWDHLA